MENIINNQSCNTATDLVLNLQNNFKKIIKINDGDNILLFLKEEIDIDTVSKFMEVYTHAFPRCGFIIIPESWFHEPINITQEEYNILINLYKRINKTKKNL